MKVSIICLLVITILFSPLATKTKAACATDMSLGSISVKSEQVFSSARNKFNPRKKPKQQRKTILNHKFKVGRGHHCPTF